MAKCWTGFILALKEELKKRYVALTMPALALAQSWGWEGPVVLQTCPAVILTEVATSLHANMELRTLDPD